MVGPLSLSPSLLLLVTAAVAEAGEKQPNILLVVADDLGWADVPWRDETVPAPTLRHLQQTGVVLNQSYVQQVCTPSRAALLTGLYPYHLGRQHRALKPLRAGGVPTNFTMLPQLLREAGYSTHIIGKWHLGYCAWEYTPTRRGFDTFYGTYLGVLDHWTHTREKYDGYDFRKNEEVLFSASGVYSTDLYTQETVRLLRERQNSSKPFFLYLPYQALHAPLQVPLQYLAKVPASVTSPQRRLYLAMLAAVDHSLAQVLDTLHQTGQYENTLIVFTTDNGGSVGHSASNFPLRGTKGTLWEGGTRAVTFLHSPLLASSHGSILDGLFHIVDWTPTLASIAGVSEQKIQQLNLDGKNQKEFILNKGESVRKEFVYNIKTSPFKAGYRSGKYKLLWGDHGKGDWYGGREARKLKNKIPWEQLQLKLIEDDNIVDLEDEDWDLDDDKSAPADNPTENFALLSQNQTVQLFDLEADPRELNDISEQRPDIVQSIIEKLSQSASTMRKGNFDLKSVLGHPFFHAGNFAPGWCKPEQ